MQKPVLNSAQQQILQAFGDSESMLVRDLQTASNMPRTQFTPLLRQLLSKKCLSIKVVSTAGVAISQRMDGHQGKQVFVVPFMGGRPTQNPVVAAADNDEITALRHDNQQLRQRIAELEAQIARVGRQYSEDELRQIVRYLQA